MIYVSLCFHTLHYKVHCPRLSYFSGASTLFSVGGWERRGRLAEPNAQGVDPLRSSGTAGRGCLLQVTVLLVGINLGGTSTRQLCVSVCDGHGESCWRSR